MQINFSRTCELLLALCSTCHILLIQLRGRESPDQQKIEYLGAQEEHA